MIRCETKLPGLLNQMVVDWLERETIAQYYVVCSYNASNDGNRYSVVIVNFEDETDALLFKIRFTALE